MTNPSAQTPPTPVPASPGIDRIVTFRNSQAIEARGTLNSITRTRVIFEVYNPYSIVQLSEVLSALTIRRGKRAVYQGSATVDNLLNTGQMLIVSARLHDAWQDLAGVLDNRVAVFEEVNRFVEDWRTANALREDYQLMVARMRLFMGETSRWLGQVDLPAAPGAGHTDSTLTDERFRDLLDALRPHAAPLFNALEEAARAVPPDEVAIHKAALQRDLHPYMLSAPFVHRAYTKPLGYAGDYKMVNMMLYNRREGPTTFAQVINALYLESGPAAAHRNRIDLLVEFLEEKLRLAATRERTLRVLNVGCGPAQELQQLFAHSALAQRGQYDLMDFNQETLDYAEQQLCMACKRGNHPVGINYIHRSVHDLLKESIRRRDCAGVPRYDVVYCAGLFDYLSDKVCARLLTLFYRWTVPGGTILTTNVHPANPIRATMEHITEWYLIYRDQHDMAALAPETGHHEVYADSTGINVFLRIDRPHDDTA